MPHLLILRFSSMGDVAMTVPVIRCFRSSYPDYKITVVSKKTYKPIFEEFSNLDFFAVDFKNTYKGLFGIFKLFKDLKKLKPTHIADLHSVLRTHVLYYLFKFNFFKVTALDKQRTERKKLFRSKNKIFKPLTPNHYKYCEVFNKLGFDVDLSKHEFINPLIINPETQNKLIELDKNKQWVGIAPFASFLGKVYPLDLTQKIIAFLQQEYNVFLFGNGEYEINKLEIWSKSYKNVFGAYKLGSLKNELEIISNLDLMISMDSANGHLAANYNVPVITLWGLTHPFAGFAPFLSETKNMFTSDREKYPKTPTSAYGKKIPKGYQEAMRTIDCNEVISRGLKILNKN